MAAPSSRSPAPSPAQGRYRRSGELLERALASIPLGAQTFSKSPTQYPRGAAPHFALRAKGARLVDADGNEYVDFVNGLAAVLLGYGDPDVDAAVRRQLEDGVTFSLSHPLEIDVAEALIERVPCAEAVRFGKNGSDATSAAVRLARAFTGRARLATSGYHGWHDWTIGATSRWLGVPAATRALTHPFPWGDLDALERTLSRHPGEFAAVTMEPMTARWPPDGYLAGVRALAHEHGALLVFDETVTGLRFARGGAQELFGVTPDLATLGKGLANGLPLSAVVGRADVLHEMEHVFVSSTFGGETLSLAAARAVLEKLDREPLLAALHARGEEVLAGTRARIERAGLGDVLAVDGHPSWSFVLFRDAAPWSAWDVKTYFLQECFARGVLTLGTHNLSCAHGPDEVAALLSAYDEVLPELRRVLDEGRLLEALRCDPLRPLFTVRP